MTTSNHQLIIDSVRNSYDDDEILIEDYTDIELAYKIFSNFRGRSLETCKGLRLTDFGNTVLGSVFKSYVVGIADFDELTIMDYIALDRLQKPFYIDKENKNIILFDKELAVLVSLCGGELKKIRNL